MSIKMVATFIDELVAKAQQQGAGLREQHLFRQTLYGLARQAKSEQLLEMRASAEKAMNAAHFSRSWRQTRAALKRIELDYRNLQQQFEFDDDSTHR
jgi:hypothetical protein